MPLKPAKRLPKRLNRPVGAYSKRLASRRRNKPKKITKFFAGIPRKAERFWKVFLREVKFWSVIVVIIAAMAGIGVLLFSPAFDVKEINVLREDARLDVDAVQRALSPLFNNRLFLVTQNDIDALLTNFPDITSVEITKDYPSSLTVKLHLDTLVAQMEVINADALVPTGTGATQSGASMQMYITSKGYVVESPIRLHDSPLPLFRIRDWGIRPTHHMQLLDEETLLTIFKARDTMMQTFGIPVEFVTIYVRAKEFHLYGNGISFWMDHASTLQEQFDRFRTFLDFVSLDEVESYIDLRLADRIVYK